MEKHKKRQYKNELQTALKFTDEDLALNRQGYLSEAQKIEQVKHLSFDMKIMLLPALFILGLFLVGSSERVYIVLSVILLCLGTFAAFQMRHDLQQEFNENRPVHAVETILSLQTSSDKTGSIYVMSLNGQSFHISMNTYAALKKSVVEGQRWLIYYLPNTKSIISAEAL